MRGSALYSAPGARWPADDGDETDYDNRTLGAPSDVESNVNYNTSDGEGAPLYGRVACSRRRQLYSKDSDRDDFDSDASGAPEPRSSTMDARGARWQRVQSAKAPRGAQWQWHAASRNVAAVRSVSTVAEEPSRECTSASDTSRASLYDANLPVAQRRSSKGVRQSQLSWTFQPPAQSITTALPGAGEVITAACVIAGGRFVITAASPPYSAAPAVRVWSRSANKLVRTLQAAPRDQGSNYSFNLNAGKGHRSGRTPAAMQGLRAPATCVVAGAGSVFVGACTGEAVLYDAASGKLTHRLKVPPPAPGGRTGGGGAVTCAALSPRPYNSGNHRYSAPRVAIGTAAGFLRIWDPTALPGRPRLLAVRLGSEDEDMPPPCVPGTPTMRRSPAKQHVVQQLRPVLSVGFSNDGNLVYAACGGLNNNSGRVASLYVFDLTAGECVAARRKLDVKPCLAVAAAAASASLRKPKRNSADYAAAMPRCLRGCEATLANGSTWAPRVHVTLCAAAPEPQQQQQQRAPSSVDEFAMSDGGAGPASGYRSSGSANSHSAAVLAKQGHHRGVGSSGSLGTSSLLSTSESSASTVLTALSTGGGGSDSFASVNNDAGRGLTYSSGVAGRYMVASGTFVASDGGDFRVFDARALGLPLLTSLRWDLALLRCLCVERRAKPLVKLPKPASRADGKRSLLSSLLSCAPSLSGGCREQEAAVAAPAKGLATLMVDVMRMEQRTFRLVVSFL